MDRGDCTFCGGFDVADYGRSHSSRDDSGGVLSLCIGIGNADGDYGCDRQCHEARIPGQRRRCALERLAQVHRITLDKTGTLTAGVPEVVDVVAISPEISQEDVFALAASAESRSEHPLGKAIVQGYQNRTGRSPQIPDGFQMMPGRGIVAEVQGGSVLAGNLECMQEQGIEITTDFQAQKVSTGRLYSDIHCTESENDWLPCVSGYVAFRCQRLRFLACGKWESSQYS